jgi:chromosomal replication initiator protein
MRRASHGSCQDGKVRTIEVRACGVATDVGSTQEVVMEDSKVVAELRTRLAEQLGQEHYELWFTGETRLCLAPQCVTIVVSSAFKRDWLRRNFAEAVQAVCAAVMGDAVRVEFAVDAVLGNESPAPKAKEMVAPMERAEAICVAMPRRNDQPARMAASFSNAINVSKQAAAPATRSEPRLAELVVGASNEYAFRTAEVTVHGLQQASPLTFSGPTGVGKTHLLRAIRAEYRLSHPRARAVYLTAEQFLTSFVEAVRGSGMPSFRQKCRGADLLLIDDVQFLIGRRASLEELLHTVDALLADGRQLVLATDKPLGDLGALGKDLLSRLASGLVCNLQLPDFTMRLEIVRRIARELRLELPADVVEWIATQINAGARELRGALNRLHATAIAFSQPITRSLAISALADLAQQSTRQVRLADVEQAVCDVFGVDREDLRSERKSRAIHEPRMLAMWLARRYTRAAWSEIGEFFGRRSHSTVISAHKRVEQLIRSRSEIALSHDMCNVEEAIRRVEAALRTA